MHGLGISDMLPGSMEGPWPPQDGALTPSLGITSSRDTVVSHRDHRCPERHQQGPDSQEVKSATLRHKQQGQRDTGVWAQALARLLARFGSPNFVSGKCEQLCLLGERMRYTV